MRSVLVLGGGSDIGLATARTLVSHLARTVILAARKHNRLVPMAVELRRLGAATVELVEFDALDVAEHKRFIDAAFDRHGDIDLVLVAFGVLGDQEVYERDAEAARNVISINFLGAVSVIIPTVERLLRQGHGTVVVLSSVGGRRGRKSNYVYAASKAGLNEFCRGLGDRLAGTGVHLMVVRPGFVCSKMTAGRPIPPLSATPGEVAGAIVKGIHRGADLVWVPSAMRWARRWEI